MLDYPITFPITKIVDETPTIKTFFLKTSMRIKPGQFAMVWVPRIDEKPLAVSYLGEDETGFSVRKVGECTSKMFEMKKGGLLGLRGPYGNGFDTEGVKKALVVGGGCGAAAIALLLDEFVAKGVDVDFVLAAKTKKELLFADRFKGNVNLHLATDDGSVGYKGYAHALVQELTQKEKYDRLYCCGSEIMMAKTLEICNKNNLDCQMGLERYMKCGFGICGQCAIDGRLVCKDGPVFNREQLNKMQEFGKFAMLKSGRKVTLTEYVDWRCE